MSQKPTRSHITQNMSKTSIHWNMCLHFDMYLKLWPDAGLNGNCMEKRLLTLMGMTWCAMFV
jgi:hypothetical protein